MIETERRRGWAAAIGSMYETRCGLLVQIIKYHIGFESGIGAGDTPKICAELLAVVPPQAEDRSLLRIYWPTIIYNEFGNVKICPIWDNNYEGIPFEHAILADPLPPCPSPEGYSGDQHPLDLMHYRRNAL